MRDNSLFPKDVIILNPERYEKIIEHHGAQCQMIKAIEEAAEFIQALSKYINTGEGVAHLAEEVADMLIMAEQVIYMIDFQDEVKHWREMKYVRTIQKLSGNNL